MIIIIIIIIIKLLPKHIPLLTYLLPTSPSTYLTTEYLVNHSSGKLVSLLVQMQKDFDKRIRRSSRQASLAFQAF